VLVGGAGVCHAYIDIDHLIVGHSKIKVTKISGTAENQWKLLVNSSWQYKDYGIFYDIPSGTKTIFLVNTTTGTDTPFSVTIE
jgi:hypothetical protein